MEETKEQETPETPSAQEAGEEAPSQPPVEAEAAAGTSEAEPTNAPAGGDAGAEVAGEASAEGAAAGETEAEAEVETEARAEAEAESEAEAEAGEAPPREPVPASDGKKHWYIVQTYSGYEQKVKLSLEKQLEKYRDSKNARHRQIVSYFGDILIPTENVVELVKGQRKTSSRKFFPGYILVQMESNDESRHFVRETPKVSGFVGGATEPTPISEEELHRILRQQTEGAERPKPKVQFERGENIRVVHGPFANFTGVVEDVKPEKGKVKVLVTIFGRATPVELSFVEVEKT